MLGAWGPCGLGTATRAPAVRAPRGQTSNFWRNILENEVRKTLWMASRYLPLSLAMGPLSPGFSRFLPVAR
eukprot:4516134-Pyramimonas_sp.AAC.1